MSHQHTDSHHQPEHSEGHNTNHQQHQEPVHQAHNSEHESHQSTSQDNTAHNGEKHTAGHEQFQEILPPVASHEKEELEQKVRDLERKNAKLKEESEGIIKELKVQLEEKNEAIKGVQDGLMKILEEAEQTAKIRTEVVEKKLRVALQEKELLAADNETIKEALQRAKDPIRDLENKLEEMQQVARSNATSAERAKLEREALSSRLEVANEQISVLESQLSAKFNGTEMTEVGKKLKAAEAKIADLENRLRVAVHQNEVDSVQIQQLQTRLETISEEKGDLLGELTQDDDSLHTMTQIHKANAEEIELLRKLVSQHEAKHKQLEQKVLNEISSRTNVTRDLETTRAQLRVKDDELRRIVANRANNEAAINKQTEAKIKDSERKLTELQKELETYRSGSLKGSGGIPQTQTPWGVKVLVPATATVLLVGVGAAIKYGLWKK